MLPIDYDVGPQSVDAFIYDGEELPLSLNITCACLTNTSDLDWITLD